MEQFDREILVDTLKKEVTTVTFTKANGDERVMVCTLIEGMLPKVEVKEGARKVAVNLEVIRVYDLDAKGWRSFRVDSVTRVVTDTYLLTITF